MHASMQNATSEWKEPVGGLRLDFKGSELSQWPHRKFGRERVLASLVENKPCSVFQRNDSVR